MSDFTAQELARIKEERGLNQQQLASLHRAAHQYAGKITKDELLDSFRRIGYISTLFEEDLKNRLTPKEEKPVRITYDLLPNGKVENFTVQPID
jgi:transcriptional regulator with XRE-family HTH domain